MSCFEDYTSNVEKRITRALLSSIFSKPGRYVRVNDGEATTGIILKEENVYKRLATTDADWIVIYEKGERLGMVWLVWGNGEDLISDYSDNEDIAAIVDPITDQDWS